MRIFYCPTCDSEKIHSKSRDGRTYDCSSCHFRNYGTLFVEESPRVRLVTAFEGISLVGLIVRGTNKLESQFA